MHTIVRVVFPLCAFLFLWFGTYLAGSDQYFQQPSHNKPVAEVCKSEGLNCSGCAWRESRDHHLGFLQWPGSLFGVNRDSSDKNNYLPPGMASCGSPRLIASNNRPYHPKRSQIGSGKKHVSSNSEYPTCSNLPAVGKKLVTGPIDIISWAECDNDASYKNHDMCVRYIQDVTRQQIAALAPSNPFMAALSKEKSSKRFNSFKSDESNRVFAERARTRCENPQIGWHDYVDKDATIDKDATPDSTDFLAAIKTVTSSKRKSHAATFLKYMTTASANAQYDVVAQEKWASGDATFKQEAREFLAMVTIARRSGPGSPIESMGQVCNDMYVNAQFRAMNTSGTANEVPDTSCNSDEYGDDKANRRFPEHYSVASNQPATSEYETDFSAVWGNSSVPGNGTKSTMYNAVRLAALVVYGLDDCPTEKREAGKNRTYYNDCTASYISYDSAQAATTTTTAATTTATTAATTTATTVTTTTATTVATTVVTTVTTTVTAGGGRRQRRAIHGNTESDYLVDLGLFDEKCESSTRSRFIATCMHAMVSSCKGSSCGMPAAIRSKLDDNSGINYNHMRGFPSLNTSYNLAQLAQAKKVFPTGKDAAGIEVESDDMKQIHNQAKQWVRRRFFTFLIPILLFVMLGARMFIANTMESDGNGWAEVIFGGFAVLLVLWGAIDVWTYGRAPRTEDYMGGADEANAGTMAYDLTVIQPQNAALLIFVAVCLYFERQDSKGGDAGMWYHVERYFAYWGVPLLWIMLTVGQMLGAFVKDLPEDHMCSDVEATNPLMVSAILTLIIAIGVVAMSMYYARQLGDGGDSKAMNDHTMYLTMTIFFLFIPLALTGTYVVMARACLPNRWMTSFYRAITVTCYAISLYIVAYEGMNKIQKNRGGTVANWNFGSR